MRAATYRLVGRVPIRRINDLLNTRGVCGWTETQRYPPLERINEAIAGMR